MSSNVLLVTKPGSAVEVLTSLLAENDCIVGETVYSCESAVEYADDLKYDIIVINSPLPDADGVQAAIDISKETVCGVIMIVQSDKTAEIGSKVIDYGVVIVPKPINKMLFRQCIGVVYAAKKRYAGLSKENERLKSSLEESKIINRAKLLLMQYLSLGEERAHRYIEKQAMDMRISKIEAARQILKTYSSHNNTT